MQRLAIAAILALTMGAWPGGTVLAQPNDDAARDRARALVQEGAELFRVGRRLAGVRKFEEAYALYPAPEILYNLGKGYRDVGNGALAHRALAQFVREAPDSPRRAEADVVLRDLELVVSLLVVEVRAEPGLRVSIDGDELGVSPIAHPIAVEPGVHQVTAHRAETLFAERQVAATRGKRITVVLEPKPEVPPPAVLADRIRTEDPVTQDPVRAPPADESKPVYARWWFWTGVGAVIAGSVAITVLATRGNDDGEGLPSLGRFPFEEF
jgi:hypothetical protein